MMFDAEKAVDAVLDAVAVPLKALAARIKAIEARPVVDVNGLKDEVSELKRRMADLEEAAEKDSISRRELQLSVSEAINSMQLRR